MHSQVQSLAYFHHQRREHVMRRLNVRPAQIDECIQKSMFTFSFKPQNPELHPGELLLLQLVKT